MLYQKTTSYVIIIGSGYVRKCYLKKQQPKNFELHMVSFLNYALLEYQTPLTNLNRTKQIKNDSQK